MPVYRTLGLLLCLFSILSAETSTPLWSRGYSIVPSPQRVQLDGQDVVLGTSWTVDAGPLGPRHIAARTLLRDFESLHGLTLKTGGGDASIRLSIAPGTVITGGDKEIDRQGYRLTIRADRIEITGNAEEGLFYGVESLLQLARRSADGRLTVPRAVIEDWPSLQLRFLHWDTKHHQDRMETLKRYLDWAARLKVNMIGFELEDKFEYPAHPVIGAPGAFTTAELQELVDYGLERYIQIVPNIQAPAHMAYALKHPEFADLRSNGNNYMANLCDERSYNLIFSMYDDVIKATKGVGYFFVSTDEIYYAGDDPRCKEPYNPVNRSLKWAEFARRAHDFLASRNRRMLAWVEYPLLPEHVKLLPPDIIDGVMGNPEYMETENKLGMRQLIYTSLQGEEKLFPNHLDLGGEYGVSRSRLQDAFDAISGGRVWKANPIGVFGAAWGDSGLHNETFWLGWSAVAQYGWNRTAAPVDQHIAEFLSLYYGPHAENMGEVYRMLQRQARAWQSSWDRVRSRERGLGYAHWDGRKGVGDAIKWDMTMTPPALPSLPSLAHQPSFSEKYRIHLAKLPELIVENDRLVLALQSNLAKADRNRYSLEVFLSLAKFAGHKWRLMAGLSEAEKSFAAAQAAHTQKKPRLAANHLLAAASRVKTLEADGVKTFRDLVVVFEKSRLPKGQSVGERKFVHIFDDTKDHWADRTPDLGYMMAPERSIRLGDWQKKLADLTAGYAKQNNVPARQLTGELEEE